MFMSFAGSATFGVSKPSGPAGQTLKPGKRVDELIPFRRFAGETVVTRSDGKELETLLPKVVGLCNHPDWHKKGVVGVPVDLDFFVTDTEILCREKSCLLCRARSSTLGSLKVSPPDVKRELMARKPPIKVVSHKTIQLAKTAKKLVSR